MGTVSPTPSRARQRLIQALHPAPGRALWRERAGLSPMWWRSASRLAERELRARDGTYDAVLQFYCVFSPGDLAARRTYGMYLDATLALTRRDHPPAAPLGPVALRRWIAYERDVYRAAARLFPMSRWVGRSLVEDYGVDPGRIIVAGAGANNVAGDLVGRTWDRRVALFVGLDWRRKGGDVLLRAWPVVRAAVPGAELWVVGTRGTEDPGAEGVRWLGRIADRARLTELYREASVFVLPSRYDPFPHVLREALGEGLPCVATRVGAVDEIVRDGDDAVVVEPEDADALAAALTALLSDPGRAEAMGRAGHRRMAAEVTWDAVADRIAPELVAAVAEGQPAAR